MIATAAANPFAPLFATPAMAAAPVGITPIAAADPVTASGAMTSAAMMATGTTIAPAMSFRGTLMAAALPLGAGVSADRAQPGATALMPPGFPSGITPPIAISAAVATMLSPTGVAAVPANLSAATPVAIAPFPVREASPAATAPMTPLVAAPLPDLELRAEPDAEAPVLPVVAAPMPDLVLRAQPTVPNPDVAAAPLPDQVLYAGPDEAPAPTPTVAQPLPGREAPPVPAAAAPDRSRPVLTSPLPTEATPIPDAIPVPVPGAAPTAVRSDAPIVEPATTEASGTAVAGKPLVSKAKSQPAPAPLPIFASPSTDPVVPAPAEVPVAAISTGRQTGDSVPSTEQTPDDDAPISTPVPPAPPVMMVSPPAPPVIREMPVAAIFATQPDAVTEPTEPETAPIGADEERDEGTTTSESAGRPQPSATGTSVAIPRTAEPVVPDRFTATPPVARAVTATPSTGGRAVRDDAPAGDAKSPASPVTSLDARSFAALVEQRAAPAAAAPASTPAIVPEARVAAEPGRMGHEMGIAIARHAAEGGGEALTVRLNPAEFGRIDVTLSFDDRGMLRAAIAAESPAALDLLRRDSADLGRALTDAGMRTDAQSFRFDARQGGGEAGGQGAPGGQRWQQSGTARAAAAVPDEAQPEYRPLRTRGRVDLMA